MKNLVFTTFLSMLVCIVFAQKQSFDVVSFTIPKGWQQTQNDGGIQLSVTDKSTGAYAIVVITKAKPSTSTANENFSNDWLKLVKGSVQVNTEPVMEQPTKENGWDIISGGANYTDAGNTGLATLLTATGGSQTVSVVLMTNSKLYQNDLVAFLNSLELAKPTQQTTNTKTVAGKASVVGLWTNYILETTGYYINGMPQYTAGYLRKEYAFYSDGTYLFRNKQWLTKTKDISFIYESGTYSVNGNQLTIIPNNGKAGFWGKTSSTKEWGSLVKMSDYKLEKTVYTFELISDPTYGNSLVLKSTKPTARDGGKFNAPNDPFEFRYSLRTIGSSIDNPPGLKTGFENKSFTTAVTPQTSSTVAANTVNAPLTGKIWEGTSSEKFTGAGAMTGHYTGGFSTVQYTFNANDTYRFVDLRASFYTDTKTIGYETGTYTISGNQLTINPVNGQNEEWSKVGKTSNGNSDVTNRAINETWGKKLKANSRKLEKYTYSFSIGKNGDKTALILQRNGRTERDGEGNTSYLNETSLERSVKLPGNIK